MRTHLDSFLSEGQRQATSNRRGGFAHARTASRSSQSPSSRYSYSRISPSTTSMMPPAESQSQLPRTPSTEVRRISLLSTGVKIDSAAAHFHGFGVARQGPWSTSVNLPSTHSGE